MFIGEYRHNLDAKGRLALPKKFLKRFSEGGVVTRGLDRCLFIYPLDEWQKLADKLAHLPISRANTRAFTRLMLAGAMDITPDKQGRFIVPDYLRKFASLSQKSVITGLFNRLEIWDENEWEKYKGRTEAESTEIAEKMSELDV